jgi:hypothetical protein
MDIRNQHAERLASMPLANSGYAFEHWIDVHQYKRHPNQISETTATASPAEGPPVSLSHESESESSSCHSPWTHKKLEPVGDRVELEALVLFNLKFRASA